MTHSTHTDDEQERKLLGLLKNHPAPAADDGFYDRALVRAIHAGSRRQRNRWLMTGFGSAIAAGVLILLVSGLIFNTEETPVPGDAIPGVSIALLAPSKVNLMFASNEALDDATLTVLLPEGIELAGFPGQREVSWQTSLAPGKNVLPLQLVAVSSAGGEVLARLEHKDRNRTFRLRVKVS